VSVTFWTIFSRSSVDATSAPTSLSFWVLAAYSLVCASSRARSVTSRAIFEAPMMVPWSSRIGETVSEMEREVPSFLSRMVS
jgi:hypothetical protein